MSRRRAAFVSCLTLALGGCLVGPDFKPPAPPDVDAYRTPESPAQKAESDTDAAQRIALGQRIPAQWWALFHSSRLDETLRQAIAASYTLAAAKATLAQVQEAIVEARAALYPQVDLGASARRSTAGAGLGTENLFPSARASATRSMRSAGHGDTSNRQRLWRRTSAISSWRRTSP